jgi:hypothetical protein
MARRVDGAHTGDCGLINTNQDRRVIGVVPTSEQSAIARGASASS